MSTKIILYTVSLPLMIWVLEVLNIDRFFKSNRTLKIQLLYLFLSMAMSYLVVNFLYDFFIITVSN